jgi:ABC-type nitrate/sulfonate/bicarbonate transport system substrate-binding protein
MILRRGFGRRRRKLTVPKLGALLAAVLFLISCLSSAEAADLVRAGKAIGSLWAFLPLDVGEDEGIFAKYGIDLQISDLGNGPKLQEALASNSIDFGLAAGTDMAFSVKGSPVRAVAAFAGAPRTVVILVRQDSPIKAVADLKGQLVGIPGAPSVAQWLVWQMSLAQGWGKNGVQTLAEGSVQANIASLLTNQVGAIAGPVAVGWKLGDQHKARIVVHLARYAPNFIAHVIFARKALIERQPDLVDRFLKGFFASIAFMKTHEAATSQIAMRVLNDSRAIADRTYDYEASWLSSNGRFDPKAVAVIKRSFVQLSMLTHEPKDDQLFTRRFVPVKF